MSVMRACLMPALCAMSLLLGCATSPPASSSGAARADVPATATNKPAAGDPDEVICRTEVPSGSHRPVRDCRTRAAWEAARRSSTGALDDLQRRTPTLPKGN